SMSTAVVSGSVALLLDAKPELNPAAVKLALQVTSSRLAGAGLIEAGAGQLNVVGGAGAGWGGRAASARPLKVASFPQTASHTDTTPLELPWHSEAIHKAFCGRPSY